MGEDTHRVERRENSLHSGHTVLVVVPDDELRRSIAFAFEAEGVCVEPHASLTAAIAASGRCDVACLVVDEAALGPRQGATVELGSVAKPLIVLADRLRTLPAIDGLTVLTKPLLGRRLVETVAGFIHAARPARALRSFP